MIFFNQYEARDIFMDFVDKHKTNMFPPNVEGTRNGFVFPTRQNCLFFFEISPTCKKYGGLFIELITGLLHPAVEQAINNGQTRFNSWDLIHFTPLDEAAINITFDIRDFRAGLEELKIKEAFAAKYNLEPDYYIGTYPDGTKGKACGLTLKLTGIKTKDDLKRTLESFWTMYYPKFQELTMLLGLED